MSRRDRIIVLWIALAVAAGGILLFAGCGDDKADVTRPGLTPQATCEGCHRDAEMLQASADPEPPAPAADPGEG